MGFGSYDESEQQDEQDTDEDNGEDVTADFKQAHHQGESAVANDTEEMFSHL